MDILARMLKSPLAHAILLVAFAAALYAPSLNYSFLFDDDNNFLDNYAVKHPSYIFAGYAESRSAGIDDTMFHHYRVRMIPYLSFAANYAAGGFAHPWHWRAVNVALHALMSVLVYWMALLLMRMPRLVGAYAEDRIIIASLGSGLLFACHPLMTETVVYVSGRVGALAAFFYAGATVGYLAWRTSSSRWAYALAVICGVLGMFSKETAFTLPLMLVLIEWLFGSLRERWRGLLPFLAMLAIIPATKFIVLYDGKGIWPTLSEGSRLLSDIPRTHYLYTQATVLVRYLQLFVLPLGQNADYNWPLITTAADERVIASAAILAAVLAAGLWSARKSTSSPILRITALGALGFFVTTSIESSVFPVIVLIAEYRTYLPSLFVIPGIVAGMLWMCEAAGGMRKPAALAVIIAAMAATLSTATLLRSRAWENDIAFWADVCLKSPGNARALNNLGNSYLRRGRYDQAALYFEQSLNVDPRFPEALTNMGAIMQMRGEHARAADYFGRSLESNPTSFRTQFNMGLALQNLGRYEEALSHYASAIALMPDFPDPYLNSGTSNLALKRYDAALGYFQKALAVRPFYMEADLNIATTYKLTGRMREAEAYARALKSKYPGYYPVNLDLGWILVENGRLDEAEAEFSSVLSMDRTNAEALGGLKEVARRRGGKGRR